jgi:3-oxoacyl-[acyl-carrier protein] reductase
LKAKVAIVTGASGGIGQAVAVRLAAEGADLALFGQNVERLQETANKVKALGRRAECYQVDNKSAEAIAGVGVRGGEGVRPHRHSGQQRGHDQGRPAHPHVGGRLGRGDDVNLRSVFLFSKAAGRLMMKQRSGSIINVASIIGLIGNPGQANYSASKGGIIAFTKSVAKELASRGVRANAIAPGFISTRMTDKLSEDLQKKMLEIIPLGRYGKSGRRSRSGGVPGGG